LLAALKPFAELSIVQRIMPHSKVQQYKYFKVLIQEFHVKVDMGFINALLEMFEAEEVSEAEEVGTNYTQLFGQGHTKETSNRNTTASSENCYQPELNAC
jgi:vacuolar protein sorting-associated protein 13A/C